MKAVTKLLIIKENNRLNRLMDMLSEGQNVRSQVIVTIETIERLELKLKSL